MVQEWIKDSELAELLDLEPSVSDEDYGDDEAPVYHQLKFGLENEVAGEVLSSLGDLGYAPGELIPGLILAALTLAGSTKDEEQALDEIADLVSDGFPEEVVEEMTAHVEPIDVEWTHEPTD